MSSNINQIPTAATSILATDKMYLGRSPFDATDDRYILGSSIIAQLAPLTTKGDLYTFSTVNARLAVGSANGQILQVASGADTGLAWSTPTYPSANGTAGQIIRSDGTNNLYTTATYPNTTTINRLLYSSANNTITDLATANSAMLVTSSVGVPIWSGTMTDGQVIIGFTGGTPVVGTITGSSGVTVTLGSGTIALTGSGGGIGWNEITGTSATMVVDAGYVANNADLVTLTLPATAAFGSNINVIGKGSGGWKIQAPGAQVIRVGNTASSAGGTVSSTNQFDSIELICTTANSVWTTLSGPQGNLTIA